MSDVVFVGIDPGLKGAIAVIYPTGEVWTHRLPLLDGSVDGVVISHWLGGDKLRGAVVAHEKVHSMPDQSSQSSFTFGRNYEASVLACRIAGVRLELVTPQAWKKAILAGVGKGDKNKKKATIAWATRAYPNVSLIPPGGRVPSDGIADALALADYCKRTYR